MNTPAKPDWSHHAERLHHAETHLAEFLFLADNHEATSPSASTPRRRCPTR